MRSDCGFTLVVVYISALFCFVSRGKEAEKNNNFSPVLNKYDFIDKTVNNSQIKTKTTTHTRYTLP